ncbi:hypothetical protein GGI07_000847 [Coemansia sp. Benny D115]|nr:hypothetical protein GGI07_000847 [Coemansia sp. Benny D115]
MDGSLHELQGLVDRTIDRVRAADTIHQNDLDTDAVIQASSELLSALSSDTDGTERVQRDIEYILHIRVAEAAERADAGDKEALSSLCTLVDLSAVLCDINKVDASLAFTLIDETMDCLSLNLAEQMFAHVERRASLLRRGVSATGGKGVVMLRLCNALLRRIPEATMSGFAGRVQLFVANGFALSERSGVNLRGDTDTTHVAQPVEEGDSMGDEEDKELYASFWSLQRVFAEPTKLAAEAGAVSEFVSAAIRTLDAFKRTTLGRAPAICLNPTGDETLRHLTAPALLRLQLADAQVKCQVLVQMLILVRHALALSGSRLQQMRETSTNKLLLTTTGLGPLSDEDQAQLRDLRKRASAHLVGAANDRGLLSRTAQFVLFHEAAWLRWKAESCKPFELPPLPDEVVAEMQDAAKGFLAHGRVVFASDPALTEQPPWALAPASIADVHGLGDVLPGNTLEEALERLDAYCRTDSDYDLLTASEQARADLLQWRALRAAVHTDMFRRIDPASRSLENLRSTQATAMEVVEQASSHVVEEVS